MTIQQIYSNDRIHNYNKSIMIVLLAVGMFLVLREHFLIPVILLMIGLANLVISFTNIKTRKGEASPGSPDISTRIAVMVSSKKGFYIVDPKGYVLFEIRRKSYLMPSKYTFRNSHNEIMDFTIKGSTVYFKRNEYILLAKEKTKLIWHQSTGEKIKLQKNKGDWNLSLNDREMITIQTGLMPVSLQKRFECHHPVIYLKEVYEQVHSPEWIFVFLYLYHREYFL